MELDVVLFILRMISMLILLIILGGLFLVIWLDYRATARQQSNNLRSYGRLVHLIQVDGHYQETTNSHVLRPLTTIGRALTSSVVIDDNFASSDHALLALRDGQWWLEDRNSRNGTLLNSEPVEVALIVTNGDIIGIGNMRFRLDLN
ncbi:MAG: FHA domain-containing protein [Aggregatilineales bacterium]